MMRRIFCLHHHLKSSVFYSVNALCGRVKCPTEYPMRKKENAEKLWIIAVNKKKFKEKKEKQEINKMQTILDPYGK